MSDEARKWITTGSISAAALSVAALFCTATYKTLDLHVIEHIDGAVQRFEGIESKAYATLGNLDDASRDWADAAQSQAQDVSSLIADFRASLKKIDAASGNAGTLLGTLNDQAKHVGPLLDSMKTATDAVPDAVSKAGTAAQSAGNMFGTLNTRLSDPAVAQLVAHLNGTAEHIDSATGDVSTAVHKAFDPPPCTGHFCAIKRNWSMIHGAIELSEPSYYLWSLITGH